MIDLVRQPAAKLRWNFTAAETISFTVSDNTIWEFSTNSLQRKPGNPIDFESLPVGDKTVSVEIRAF